MPRPARSSGDDRLTWGDAAETAQGSRSRPPAPRFQAPVCLLLAGRARLPPQLRALGRLRDVRSKRVAEPTDAHSIGVHHFIPGFVGQEVQALHGPLRLESPLRARILRLACASVAN